MTGVVTRVYKNQGENGKKRADGTIDRGGYFFIRGEDGHDRFAHARDIGQEIFVTLQEHTKVEFHPISGGSRGNGLRAEHVVVLA